jgi:hypothetical protein
MAFDTKLNLNNLKFSQLSGETLNLSGTTIINGVIEYGEDKSLEYNDRSLVDRGYVNNSLGVIITGATNGLSVNNKNVGLGGIVVEDVTISGGTLHCLNLGVNNSKFNSINLFSVDQFKFVQNTETNGANISGGNCALNLMMNVDVDCCTGFEICATRIKVFSQCESTPMLYDGDYSVNIQPRSIPDAEWVTGQTITNQFVTGATNGLNLTNNQIGLGGILSENTSISGGSRNLCLGTILSPLDNLVVRTNTGFNLSTGTVTQGPLISTDYCCLMLNYVDDYSTSGTTTGFEISGGDLKVVDYLNARPMYYAADYSANIEPRSIPDAEWVTGQTIVNQFVTGATNGLTLSGQTVQLGGESFIDVDIYTSNHYINLFSDNGGSETIELNIENGNGFISVSDTSGNSSTIRITATGLKYDNDHSANIEPRSIPDAEWVTGVTSAYQTITGVTNLGGGEGVFSQILDKNIELKSLVGGDNVIITGSGDTILISASISGATFIEDIDNIGSGLGLYSGSTGIANKTAKFYSILGGENVDIQLSGDTYVFNVPSSGLTFIDSITNIGSGLGLYSGTTNQNAQLYSILAGENVNIELSGDTYIFSVPIPISNIISDSLEITTGTTTQIEFTGTTASNVSFSFTGLTATNVDSGLIEVNENANLEVFLIPLSNETTELVPTSGASTFTMPFNYNLSGLTITVVTPPSGTGLTVDIQINSISIFNDVLTIDADETTSETSSSPYDLATTTLTKGGVITIDIDTVGTSYGGAGLKLTMIGYKY